MEKIVLDTSVVVKWFSDEKGRDKALGFLSQLQEGKIQIYLPELTKYELANALLKGKRLTAKQAEKFLSVFYGLPVEFISEDVELAADSCRIASGLKITYYDACFISLAKKLKAVLVTANPRHQKSVRGVRVVSV